MIPAPVSAAFPFSEGGGFFMVRRGPPPLLNRDLPPPAPMPRHFDELKSDPAAEEQFFRGITYCLPAIL